MPPLVSRTENSSGSAVRAPRARALSEWPIVLLNMTLRGLTLLSRFLLTVLLARLLQPEDVGVYGLLASALAWSTFVLGLEYYWFTMRELASETDDGRARVLRDQLALHVLLYLTLLPMLALVFFSVLPRSAFRWFLMLAVLEHLSQEVARSLIALGRPLAANVVLFVRSGAWVYPALWLLLQHPESRDLSTVVVFWFAGLLASFGVAAFQLRRLPWAGAVASAIDPARVGRGLRTAAPFIVTTGSAMTVLFMDRFIIRAFHGLGPVGVYTFFGSITTAVHLLVNTSLVLTRVPELVRAHECCDGRFTREVRILARQTVVSSLLLAAAAVVCIHPVLNFIGKSVYQDAIPVFLLLLGGAVVRCIADVPLYALYAQRRDYLVLSASAAAAVTSVVLNLLLVRNFSLLGAAVSALVSSLVILVVSLVALVPFRQFPSPDTAAIDAASTHPSS